MNGLLRISNSGTISGIQGIVLGGEGNITNNANGVITGSSGIAILVSGGQTTLSNAGKINGNVILNDFANSVTLLSGGVITGTLNVGSAAAATLTLDGAGSQLLSQAVTGTIGGFNSLTKLGTGTWVIDENLSYGGSTTIAAGTLQIGNGGTVGSIPGNVLNSGVLSFDRADAITFAGVISGSGSVAQNGLGTVTLTGTNSYVGGTNLNAGIVAITKDANLGTGPLNFDGGTLEILATAAGLSPTKQSLWGTVGEVTCRLNHQLDIVRGHQRLGGPGERWSGTSYSNGVEHLFRRDFDQWRNGRRRSGQRPGNRASSP